MVGVLGVHRVMFFLSFAAIASGSASASVMLTFYAAVAWIWLWHAAIHADLLGPLRVAVEFQRESC